MEPILTNCRFAEFNVAEKRAMADRVLDVLKEQNYVHGDLRLPNLIVKEKCIKVLDFDWAGVEGDVYYPVNLNTYDIQWPQGVDVGKEIRSQHDRTMIYTQLGLSTN